MDKRLKARWVKALRSGKYKQGQHRLNYYLDGENYFCCLGVLRDIAPGVVRKSPGLDILVAKSCGIPSETQTTLARKNDDGKSFRVIATWIEKNL